MKNASVRLKPCIYSHQIKCEYCNMVWACLIIWEAQGQLFDNELGEKLKVQMEIPSIHRVDLYAYFLSHHFYTLWIASSLWSYGIAKHQMWHKLWSLKFLLHEISKFGISKMKQSLKIVYYEYCVKKLEISNVPMWGNHDKIWSLPIALHPCVNLLGPLVRFPQIMQC